MAIGTASCFARSDVSVEKARPGLSWHINILCGDVAVRLTRAEAATLAADLLDAIGQDNALPPPLEAAIKRNEVGA